MNFTIVPDFLNPDSGCEEYYHRIPRDQTKQHNLPPPSKIGTSGPFPILPFIFPLLQGEVQPWSTDGAMK